MQITIFRKTTKIIAVEYQTASPVERRKKNAMKKSNPKEVRRSKDKRKTGVTDGGGVGRRKDCEGEMLMESF